jgi:NAD(P)-dependent dehydrogenase (short-subunit alcohol dehydrogenase family)
MTVLVVGSRPGSLGTAVRDLLQNRGLRVVTAGVSGEMFHMDITDPVRIAETINAARPSQVVCTAGINESYSLRAEGLTGGMEKHLAVNATGVVSLLQEWVHMLESTEVGTMMRLKQFVAISSNSAHIARRQSIAYCASKAALSMALRCAAREIAGEGMLVYGYEPGLLAGTPMTAGSADAFPGALHRMPGVKPEGLSTMDFASTIVANLIHPNLALHGTMLRLDAGEQ